MLMMLRRSQKKNNIKTKINQTNYLNILQRLINRLSSKIDTETSSESETISMKIKKVVRKVTKIKIRVIESSSSENS